MGNTVNKAIKVFKSEVGYQEKKTNSQLESEHSNVGSNNFTKYGLEMGCNGQAWCLAFCEWCMVEAYGKDSAKKMLGGFTNYTPTGADYFKKMKRWFTDPKVGDFVFFYSSELKRISHVGFVYKVDSNKVYTIEGNTSSSSTEFERDGGCVAYKEYVLSNTRLKGFGRPKYDTEIKTPIITSTKKINPYKKPTTTIRKGDSGESVKWLQFELQEASYSKVAIDGKFGSTTLKYLKKFQTSSKIEVDGICGSDTIKELVADK